TKEALQLAKLDSTSMNSIKIQKSVREMKNDANLIDYIEKAVRQKNRHDENYNQALTYAGRLFMNEQDDYKSAIYSTLLPGLKIEDIPEFMMREALTDNMQLKNAASFRAIPTRSITQYQQPVFLPEYVYHDDLDSYVHMDSLQIRRL